MDQDIAGEGQLFILEGTVVESNPRDTMRLIFYRFIDPRSFVSGESDNIGSGDF